MDPSEFTLRILLLFLPGIVTRLLIERLTVPHDKGQLYFFLHAFITGVFAYLCYAAVLVSWGAIFGFASPRVYFLAALLDSNQPISVAEVGWVCAIAIVNGFALSALINHKTLSRLAQRLRITKRFGDFDVWGFLHTSTTDSLKWVRVRDHQHNLCYEGWVGAFSDTHAPCELFLREVRVFRNDSGKQLYEVPGLYLTQDPQAIALEFYALTSEQPKSKGRANVRKAGT